MTKIFHEKIVPAKHPWSGVIAAGDVLVLTDLEGQQAVDFLCYDGKNTAGGFVRLNELEAGRSGP